MNKKPLIKVSNASLELAHKLVLEDVNLTINENESIVLIGPSGGGKTVLLKLLAGVYMPTKGHVTIHDEDWQNLQSEEKHHLARKVGMMFQQGALFDNLTAQENIEFPIKEHLQLTDEEAHELSKDILEKVNLGDSMNKLPSQLSGGMQKRLALARALVLSPEVAFYDDPVAGQDPIQRDQMRRLMLDYKNKNQSTLILSTSNMQTAFKMADRIFMVIDKQVFETGSPEETKKHPDPRVQQFINGDLEGPLKISKL